MTDGACRDVLGVVVVELRVVVVGLRVVGVVVVESEYFIIRLG